MPQKTVQCTSPTSQPNDHNHSSSRHWGAVFSQSCFFLMNAWTCRGTFLHKPPQVPVHEQPQSWPKAAKIKRLKLQHNCIVMDNPVPSATGRTWKEKKTLRDTQDSCNTKKPSRVGEPVHCSCHRSSAEWTGPSHSTMSLCYNRGMLYCSCGVVMPTWKTSSYTAGTFGQLVAEDSSCQQDRPSIIDSKGFEGKPPKSPASRCPGVLPPQHKAVWQYHYLLQPIKWLHETRDSPAPSPCVQTEGFSKVLLWFHGASWFLVKKVLWQWCTLV